MQFKPITPTQRRVIVDVINTHAITRGDFVLASGARTNWKIEMEKAAFNAIGSWVLPDGLLTMWYTIGCPNLAGVASGGTYLMSQMITTAVTRGDVLTGYSVEKKPDDSGSYFKGEFLPGKPVILIEDVVTSGTSVERAIEKIMAAGGSVAAILSVVDREPDRPKEFAHRNIPYFYLINVNELAVPKG